MQKISRMPLISFFTTIGTELESKLPPAQCNPMQYLQGDFPNLMPKPRITINDIFREVKTLKNKSCNAADFSPELVKENCWMLAFPLTFMLHQPLDQGKFPTRLKSARLTSIYKKGVKSDMNNYRPISILNIFSKIFEKSNEMVLDKFHEWKQFRISD